VKTEEPRHDWCDVTDALQAGVACRHRVALADLEELTYQSK
jgi:hypothetical protein